MSASKAVYACVVCGKESTHPGPLVFWVTDDGFEVDKPACGCGYYIHCKECVINACPKCGCREFYT